VIRMTNGEDRRVIIIDDEAEGISLLSRIFLAAARKMAVDIRASLSSARTPLQPHGALSGS
jgi:hypothetical protein